MNTAHDKPMTDAEVTRCMWQDKAETTWQRAVIPLLGTLRQSTGRGIAAAVTVISRPLSHASSLHTTEGLQAARTLSALS